MATKTYKSVTGVERAWGRLGWGVGAGGGELEDLEALLVATGVLAASNSVVFARASAWLVRYGCAVARHRLVAKLATAPSARRGVGTMVARALATGAPAELALVLRACGPTDDADGQLEAPEMLAHEGVLRANPFLRERLMRKGDLRCSIIEVLRHDVDGSVRAAAELARLTATTRAAVNKALRALYLEGDVVIRMRAGRRREYEVVLTR